MRGETLDMLSNSSLKSLSIFSSTKSKSYIFHKIAFYIQKNVKD